MNRINNYLVLVLLAGIILFFVHRGQFEFAALVPVALLACWLVTVRGRLIYWALFAEFSLLTLPVTALRQFSLAFLLQLVFVVGEILNQLAGKKKLNYPKSSKFLFVFVALLAVTAKIRGFGIYALGGSSIGGMDYVVFGIRMAFIAFVLAYANTYRMDIKKMYRFVLIGTLVYFVFNMLIYFVPSTTFIVKKFCNVMFAGGGAEVVAEKISKGLTAERRIYSLYYVPFALMPYVMRQALFKKRIVLGAGCVLLAAMSGFRTAVVIVGSLFVFAELFIYKLNVSKAMLSGMIVVLFLGASWVALPMMDARIQRAYMVVPGFKSRVPITVSISAEGSTEWRENLYALCLKRLPQYLLVGRGVGDDLTVVYNRVVLRGNRGMSQAESAEFAYASHAYHLAIFELFIEYGGIAACFMLGAFFLLMRRGRFLLRKLGEKASSDEKYALACFVAMLAGVLTYFSSFAAGFLNMVMYGAVALAFVSYGRVAGGEGMDNEQQ
jgi:hypothetical protein